MYYYVRIILDGKQVLDSVELIASSMRNQLKYAKFSKEGFYMSSYLTYCISYVSKITSLSHESYNEEVTVYQYCPLLQRDKVLEDFRRPHDV